MSCAPSLKEVAIKLGCFSDDIFTSTSNSGPRKSTVREDDGFYA